MTNRSPEQRLAAERLCRMLPVVTEACSLALRFIRIVRERRAGEFDEWLRCAERSSAQDFRSFACGLRKDYEEVAAALRLEWSNGQVEGQVNRLKLLKRAMYGRANLDLLKARAMRTA